MVVKKKGVKKSVKKRSTKPSKSSSSNYSWSFPKENIHLIRIETFVVTISSFFVFIFMFVNFDQRIFPAAVFTLFFLGIFMVVTLLMKKLRDIRFKYVIEKDHLAVTKVFNGKKTSFKIKLKDINFSKFDRIFLGGYLLTDNKRHPVFFNNLAELDILEEKINNL